MIDVRLAIPAAAAWGGLVIVLPHPEGLGGLALGAGSVGLASVGFAVAVRRRAPEAGVAVLAVLGLAACAVAAVAVSAALTLPARQPPELGHATTVTAVGRVTAAPDRDAGRLRLLVSSLTVSGVTRQVSLPVLATDVPVAKGAPPALHDEIEVSGRLAPADGGGDLAGFLAASSPPRVVAAAGGLAGAATRLRESYVAIARGLPGDGGALLPGLSVGDTTAVDASLDAAMTASGLSHLTAVSGANCAVVVGAVLMIGAALGVGRVARTAAAAAVLVGFVVLVTPEPSVLRAAAMALVGLTLSLAGRPVRLLPLISLTVLGLLLHDPWLARSYAFALSVLATTGLAVLAVPLTRILARAVPEPLALALAVPIAAQLACQPLLLTLDPRLPLVSVAANLLSEPAAPIATLVGGAACLLSPVWPAGAHLVAAVAWLPAAWIAAVARFFSALPRGQLDWGGTAPAIVLAAALTLLASAVVLTTPNRRSRRVAVIALAVVALPVVTTVGGRELGRSVSFPRDWQMMQCTTFPVE